MKKRISSPHYRFTATIALLNGLRIEDKSGSFGKKEQPECWMIQNLEGGQVRLSFQAKDGMDGIQLTHRLMQREARTRKTGVGKGKKVGAADYRLVALTSEYTGGYDLPKGANPAMQPKRKGKDQTVEMCFDLPPL
jgi:hypothetical protein